MCCKFCWCKILCFNFGVNFTFGTDFQIYILWCQKYAYLLCFASYGLCSYSCSFRKWCFRSCKFFKNFPKITAFVYFTCWRCTSNLSKSSALYSQRAHSKCSPCSLPTSTSIQISFYSEKLHIVHWYFICLYECVFI